MFAVFTYVLNVGKLSRRYRIWKYTRDPTPEKSLTTAKMWYYWFYTQTLLERAYENVKWREALKMRRMWQCCYTQTLLQSAHRSDAIQMHGMGHKCLLYLGNPWKWHHRIPRPIPGNLISVSYPELFGNLSTYLLAFVEWVQCCTRKTSNRKIKFTNFVTNPQRSVIMITHATNAAGMKFTLDINVRRHLNRIDFFVLFI